MYQSLKETVSPHEFMFTEFWERKLHNVCMTIPSIITKYYYYFLGSFTVIYENLCFWSLSAAQKAEIITII